MLIMCYYVLPTYDCIPNNVDGVFKILCVFKILHIWSCTEPSVFRTLAVFVLELAILVSSSS